MLVLSAVALGQAGCCWAVLKQQERVAIQAAGASSWEQRDSRDSQLTIRCEEVHGIEKLKVQSLQLAPQPNLETSMLECAFGRLPCRLYSMH